MADMQNRLEKTKQNIKENLNTVRAGRANSALLDRVMVEYYGVPTPLKSLANIQVPDPRQLLITPFDPKSVGDINKAINAANLGLNPTNDGKCIRIEIPALTEERRKELTKTVKKMGEDAKVAIRNIRREENEELKKKEKAGDISEDELSNELDDVQKAIDKAIKEVDAIVEAKDKEILAV